MGFGNAAMHTFIDAQDSSIMLVFKKWTPTKYIGWQPTNQDIKLVGVVYLNSYDLFPTFIYGNTYDELIFRARI
jgi:hypothetical protein